MGRGEVIKKIRKLEISHHFQKRGNGKRRKNVLEEDENNERRGSHLRMFRKRRFLAQTVVRGKTNSGKER